MNKLLAMLVAKGARLGFSVTTKPETSAGATGVVVVDPDGTVVYDGELDPATHRQLLADASTLA